MRWTQKQFYLSTFEAIRNNQGDYDRLLKATAESGIDLVELVFKDRKTVTDILPHFRGTGLKAVVQDRVIGGIGDEFARPDEAAVRETLAHYQPYDDVIAGYYLWDEPVQEAFCVCYENRELMETCVPEKILLFNIFPSYGVYGWDAAAYNWKDNSYTRYVDEFLSTVKPAVLMMDHYPYRPAPCTLHRSDIWRDVGYCSVSAHRQNIPFWFYFEGVDMSTGDLGKLTPAHVAAQMFGALAYGAKALSWFCSMGILTDIEGNRLPNFNVFRDLNLRVKRLGSYLFPFTLNALTHTDLDAEENAHYFAATPDALQGVDQLPVGVIAALFTNTTGVRSLLLVNKDTTAACAGQIKLSRPAQVAAFDLAEGCLLPAQKAQAWEVTLMPGEGELWEFRQ